MDMKRADIGLLLSLDVLLDERHVSRAAARLNLSQSAMSSQLARLRAWFGDPLLIPSGKGRGMVLTPRAEALQGPLRAALQNLDEAIAPDAFDPRHDARTFTIAANDNAFSTLVRPLAHTVLREAPAVRLRCIAPDYADMATRMERGEVDLYVGAARMVAPSLKQRPLLRDTFRVARRHDDPTPMDMAVYTSRPHVLISPAGQFASRIDEAMASLRQKRRVAMTVATYTQAAAMVACSDALATLPGAFLRSVGFALRVDSLPFALDAFDYAMAWHPRVQGDPAHRWLRERLLAAVDQVMPLS
jgi:DNA-binding transcriptional LysR family regulator